MRLSFWILLHPAVPHPADKLEMSAAAESSAPSAQHLQWLLELKELMGRRVSAYNTFEAGFRICQEKKQLAGYSSLCAVITKQFQGPCPRR